MPQEELVVPEPGPVVLQQLQDVFDSVDVDKSGEIDANELSNLVQSVKLIRELSDDYFIIGAVVSFKAV